MFERLDFEVELEDLVFVARYWVVYGWRRRADIVTAAISARSIDVQWPRRERTGITNITGAGTIIVISIVISISGIGRKECF